MLELPQGSALLHRDAQMPRSELQRAPSSGAGAWLRRLLLPRCFSPRQGSGDDRRRRGRDAGCRHPRNEDWLRDSPAGLGRFGLRLRSAGSAGCDGLCWEPPLTAAARARGATGRGGPGLVREGVVRAGQRLAPWPLRRSFTRHLCFCFILLYLFCFILYRHRCGQQDQGRGRPLRGGRWGGGTSNYVSDVGPSLPEGH